MIAILGDVHFNSSKDYLKATCDKFLEWFEKWDKNSKGNELILAGDLVQSYLNGGTVIDFLERMWLNSKFDHIHIIEGNHDRKKLDNSEQLAYEFLRNKKNVTIYGRLTEVKIQNLLCLMMPFFTRDSHNREMRDVYSNLYKNPKYQKHYDLAVGHFCEKQAGYPGAGDCVDNLDKLNIDVLCLGHIHTRVNPNIYIGSVYASRKNEIDYSRAAWIYDGENWTEETLPVFNDFLTVVFPNKLPKSIAQVPIYTILNCSSEAIAKRHYGNIFIRKCTIADSDETSYKKEYLGDEMTLDLGIPDLFKSFCESQTPSLSNQVISLCENYLDYQEAPIKEAAFLETCDDAFVVNEK